MLWKDREGGDKWNNKKKFVKSTWKLLTCTVLTGPKRVAKLAFVDIKRFSEIYGCNLIPKIEDYCAKILLNCIIHVVIDLYVQCRKTEAYISSPSLEV